MQSIKLLQEIRFLLIRIFVTFSNLTFEELLHNWWDKYKNELLSEGSIDRKESIMRNHIIPELGKYKINELDENILKNYMKSKHDDGDLKSLTCKGLSYSTIRDHFNIIRPALDYAVTQGMVFYNPARKIKIPREHFEANPITFSEVVSLLQNSEKNIMRCAILIAFTTGMRPGEIYGLKKSDIYFDRKFLTIRRSVVSPKPGDAIVHETKTASSRRRIDLDDMTLQVLALLVNHSQSEFLFVDDHGNQLSPWYNKVFFDKAAKKAGIVGKRFYDLRHGHATYLLMHNINIKEIQERMGHSSIRITIDTYGHLFPTIQQQSVALLNGLPCAYSCSPAKMIQSDDDIKSLSKYIIK